MAVQPLAVRCRPPVIVDVTVVNEQSEPIADLTLTTRENGRRYVVPIPFTWSWISKGWTKEHHTDQNGQCSLKFRDDHLKLESIRHGDTVFPNCESRHYQSNGRVQTNQTVTVLRGKTYTNAWVTSWHWGVDPSGKAPIRKNCEITIKDTEPDKSSVRDKPRR